jgi:hypothetical protein
VPSTNNFAKSISLSHLAQAMQKPGGAMWSDLGKGWPARKIQWVFSSQEDFRSELSALGIKPPDHYQLAPTYESAFLNLYDNPYNLLMAPVNTGSNAKLQGADFRIIPTNIKTGSKSASLGPESIEFYTPKLVKGAYIFTDSSLPQHCVMLSLASFLIKNNRFMMPEDGFLPLPPPRTKCSDHRARQTD